MNRAADEIQFGGAGGRPRRRALPVRVALAAVAVIVVGAGLYVASTRSTAKARSATAHAPLLGITGGWELFGQGPDAVVRIQFAGGLITRTDVPLPAATGAVSFVVTSDAAIVRPNTVGVGYQVPDGQPARPLTGALADRLYAYPGPGASGVWVPDSHGMRFGYALVDADGRAMGPLIADELTDSYVGPDGNGYPVEYLNNDDIDGVEAVLMRPGQRTPLPAGMVLGTGPRTWVTEQCTPTGRCTATVRDRITGTSHPVSDDALPEGNGENRISPDGRYLAEGYRERCGGS